MIRVATWNVEWAAPETKAGKRIQRIIEQIDADIFLLTEGCKELMPEGFMLDCGTDWGYESTIKGEAASRFTVSIGKIEQFGTAVEDIDNRDLGIAGVMDWYASEDVMDNDVVTPVETSTAPASDNSSVVAVVGARVRKGRKLQ